MTPAELHSRILLHELRTILLDESREGAQLPSAYKELIQSDPHNPSSYLITAEELEEHGDPLAELCRIQVELIGLIPHHWIGSQSASYEHFKGEHPFRYDMECFDRGTPDRKMAERRLNITQDTLYHDRACRIPTDAIKGNLSVEEWHIRAKPYLTKAGFTSGLVEFPTSPSEEGFATYRQPRSSRLGRTTRMLTDILRYCAMNQGKHVLCLGIGADHAAKLLMDTQDLAAKLGITTQLQLRATLTILDSSVHFAGPGGTNQLVRTHNVMPNQTYVRVPDHIPQYIRDQFYALDPRPWDIRYSYELMGFRGIQYLNPDITFTDHACHTVVPRIIRNESGGPPIPFITQATEDAAREIERNHRIRAIMAQDGRIQYNPKVAIRPESVIPDEPTETHLP